MGAPYRNDSSALLAQCDSLRDQLENAKEDADESKRLRRLLEAKLKELERSRLTVAEREAGERNVGRRRLVLGALIGVLLCALAVALPRVFTAEGEEAAQEAGTWWSQARPHCNSIEVDTHVARHPAPDTDQGQGWLATCYALANKIDLARSVILSVEQHKQPWVVKRLFDIVHPIADAGDDVAAGPVMELVVEFLPDNFMAQFHAGMAAYENGRNHAARSYLSTFLGQYSREDNWRRRAKNAMADINGSGE